MPSAFIKPSVSAAASGTLSCESAKPVRVLHLLGQLSRGGVEVWLLNVLRNIDRNAYRFDFAVHNREPGSFDAEVRELGSRIFIVDAPQKSPLFYQRQLARLIRGNGPFDIVHSHVHFFSGSILSVAAECGIPVCIAHSHVDGRPLEREANRLRKFYYWFMRRRIYRYAKLGLACSAAAAASLYGENWASDGRWQVVPYGLDFSRFSHAFDRQRLCRELGIPSERQIIGQVGRLDTQKNHTFAIQVVQELTRRGLDIHYLPVGGGPLESNIRAQLEQAGLSGRATVAGDQPDVAPYFGLMHCMIFPSFMEGLPVAMLESQAAGVPIVASDRISSEIAAIAEMVDYLPLEAGVQKWADAVQRRLGTPRRDSLETAAHMASSEFAINRSVEKLCTIYRQLLAEHP